MHKTVREISYSLKDKYIETIYFTGTPEFLDCYIPCKFIVDREVINTAAEIIEINELLTRKPNRLNENSIVVFSYGDSLEPHELNNMLEILKERKTMIIGLSETTLSLKCEFDYFIPCDNNSLKVCVPSAALLLTCGIMHQREADVYSKLYSGMEENIQKLKQYSKEDIQHIFNLITKGFEENKKINIIASGTDVATQLYLMRYFKEGKQLNVLKSGEFINQKEIDVKTDEYYLLILGMDSSKELDEAAFEKIKELNVDSNVFEVEKIAKLSNLDRPFAKVISSTIVFCALNNQLK